MIKSYFDQIRETPLDISSHKIIAKKFHNKPCLSVTAVVIIITRELSET